MYKTFKNAKTPELQKKKKITLKQIFNNMRTKITKKKPKKSKY